MNQGKFLQFSTALLAATSVAVSRHHRDHLDPEQPQQPGSLWATTISGTSTAAGALSAMGVSSSSGSFDLRAG